MFAQFRRVFADLALGSAAGTVREPAAPARDNEIVHPMLLRVHLGWRDFAIPGHASSYTADVTPN
jgi:hypothetical protein